MHRGKRSRSYQLGEQPDQAEIEAFDPPRLPGPRHRQHRTRAQEAPGKHRGLNYREMTENE